MGLSLKIMHNPGGECILAGGILLYFEDRVGSWIVWTSKYKQSPAEKGWALFSGVPKGNRTPVAAVKGRSPRPLDDGDINKRGNQ